MKYTLKNKQIELTDEEVAEIVKQKTAIGICQAIAKLSKIS